MNTAANVRKSEGSHYYYPNGTPAYEIAKKSGVGMKKPNITDARELGLLPSVTTILKVLSKPALEQWKMEQACLAVLTSIKLPNETLDEFVHRILQVDREHEAEAKIAADKGTAIHEAVELAVQGKEFDPEYRPYIEAIFPVLQQLGRVVWAEKVFVGPGYACRADLGLESDRHILILDLKTTGKLPKDSYFDHKLQTAAQAKAHGNSANKHLLTGNLYISTKEPGKVVLSLQDNWENTYENGFLPLLKYWQFANNYQVS